MAAVPFRVEVGPDERVTVWCDAVYHAFVDNPLGRTLAIERVAIDQPHGHGLSKAVRSLRIRVNILAVEFEPELARVIGEDVLVVDLRRRPVQEDLLLNAAFVRRIDNRSGVLEAVRELQRRIGSIEIDSPRADDWQLRRIRLLARNAVASKEPDRRRFGHVLGLTTRSPLRAAAAACFLAKRRQLAERHRGDEGHNEQLHIADGSAHFNLLSHRLRRPARPVCLLVRVLQVHQIDVPLMTGIFDIEVGRRLEPFHQCRRRHGPWTREHFWVVDRHRPLDRVCVEHLKSLDKMRIGAVKITTERHAWLVVEVRAVDDERVAFPMADWITQPQPDARRQVLLSIHGDDARDVLIRVDDEVVPREPVFLREAVDPADVIELAMADLIFVAVRVISAPVALLERPGLVGDDAVGRVDDQRMPAEDAKAARVLLENYGVCDATWRSVERSSQIRVAVWTAWDRSRLGRRGGFRAVDTRQTAGTSELPGD